ncbi:MAG: hypothetical protein AAF547_06380 [Actinomycetota bacterium]
MCFGEFCRVCMVTPRGHRDPLCQECALIVGGLRPKTKPRVRGNKKTAKARRAALRAAAPTDVAMVTFGDREAKPDGSEGLIPLRADGELSSAKEEDPLPPLVPDPDPDFATEVAPTDAPEVSAVDQLDRIRGAAAQPPPGPAAAPPPIDGLPPMPTSPRPPSPAQSARQGPTPSTPLTPTAEHHDEGQDTPDAGVERFRAPRPFIARAAAPAPKVNVELSPAVTGPVDRDHGSPDSAPIGEIPVRPEADEPSRTVRRTVDPDGDPGPVEPVSIYDDPWARTKPMAREELSEHPFRLPDPLPVDDVDDSPPEWTTQKLPPRD